MGARWEAEWKRGCLKRRHYTKSRRGRNFWSRYVGDTESHTNKRLDQGFFKKCRGFLGLPEILEDPLRSPLTVYYFCLLCNSRQELPAIGGSLD